MPTNYHAIDTDSTTVTGVITDLDSKSVVGSSGAAIKNTRR
jgi:hypothetical protein